MLGLLVMMLLATLGVGTAIFVHRSTQLRREYDELTQAMSQAEELVWQLHSRCEMLRRDIELVRSGFTAEEAARFLYPAEKRLARAVELVGDRDRLSDVRTTGRRSLAVRTFFDRHELDSLVTTRAAWQKLARATEELIPALEEQDARLTEALTTVTDLPQRIQRASTLVEEVRDAAATARTEGFVVEEESAILRTAPNRLAEIERRAADREILSTDASLARLTEELSAAQATLRTMRTRAERTASRVEQLTANHADLERRRHAADSTHQTLADNYASSISAETGALLDRVDERIASAAAKLAEAGRHLTAGDLHGAERALDSVDETHGSIDEDLDIPEERLERVRALSESLPRRKGEVLERLAAVERDTAAEMSVQDLVAAAAELRTQLERLDMSVDRPDWLAFERRLDDIEAVAVPIGTVARQATKVITDLRGSLTRLRAEMGRVREQVRWANGRRGGGHRWPFD